jgi:hypothetical protein
VTVPETDDQSRLEIAKVRAEPVIGRQAASRIAAFENGELYVEAGWLAAFLAWFADFLVFAAAVAAGFVLVGGVTVTARLSTAATSVLVVALVLIVPALYSVCYRNGRALGAVLTDTQLVRVSDGGRLGKQAYWAMLIRTVLMPLLLALWVASFFLGSALEADDGTVRTSIDRHATRRLRAMDLPEQ